MRVKKIHCMNDKLVRLDGSQDVGFRYIIITIDNNIFLFQDRKQKERERERDGEREREE